MLFFLWGVFRGKKESCSNPPKNTRLPASCVLPNMKKAFSTRETFHHENPSNRESLTDRTSNRMQSCMKVGCSSPLLIIHFFSEFTLAIQFFRSS